MSWWSKHSLQPPIVFTLFRGSMFGPPALGSVEAACDTAAVRATNALKFIAPLKKRLRPLIDTRGLAYVPASLVPKRFEADFGVTNLTPRSRSDPIISCLSGCQDVCAETSVGDGSCRHGDRRQTYAKQDHAIPPPEARRAARGAFRLELCQ